VKIFGVERDLRAEVVVMNGFSAHADQKDLTEFVSDARQGGRLKKVILVHGEPGPQKILGELLRKNGHDASGDLAVHAPASGDRISV
jgi:metallo-beta-lactamase family protein